jgi:hypothetical protein
MESEPGDNKRLSSNLTTKPSGSLAGTIFSGGMVLIETNFSSGKVPSNQTDIDMCDTGSFPTLESVIRRIWLDDLHSPAAVFGLLANFDEPAELPVAAMGAS